MPSKKSHEHEKIFALLDGANAQAELHEFDIHGFIREPEPICHLILELTGHREDERIVYGGRLWNSGDGVIHGVGAVQLFGEKTALFGTEAFEVRFVVGPARVLKANFGEHALFLYGPRMVSPAVLVNAAVN